MCIPALPIIKEQVIQKTPTEWFIIIAPELKNIDYTGALEVAELRVPAGLCGDKRPLLVAYLAAHTLALANPMLSSANIRSVTEGAVSTTFKNSQSSTKDGEYGLTTYGQVYDSISRSCIMAVTTRDSAYQLYPEYPYGYIY